MNIVENWLFIDDVEIAPLLAWVQGEAPGRWSDVGPAKPSRIHADQLPMHLVQPIMDDVLAHFRAGAIAHEPMLSRMLPGQTHGYHVDVQRSDCITRVHVPITTNDGCWMAFEEDGGEHVHFEAGRAYTFNTAARHAFGNDGFVERVHLIFEVLG